MSPAGATRGPIRGIIFDFGRVISDFDVGIFVAKAAAHSSLSPEDLKRAVHDAGGVAARYETGVISSDEFYREVSRLAALSMGREEFIRAYTQIFTPIDSTAALIRKLKGRYKLGLLSNTNAWHYEFGIRPVDVFPLFDAVTLSFEVKAMKPDRRIYEDMLRKLGLPASSCVYIDDIPEFVEAGKAMGLRALRYTTHEKLVRDLRDAGVQVPEN